MATPVSGATRGDTAVGPSTGQGRGTGLRSPSDQPSAGRSPAALSLVTLTLAALLAGLGIGRFVSVRPAARVPPAPRPAAQTLSEQIDALEQRVERAPSDLAGWQQLGERYLLQAGATGDASYGDLAERAFARAEVIAPDDPEATLRASVGRAMLALTRHQFDTALALGEAVLSGRPASREALVVVVDAQVELGRYDDAAADLQTLLDLRPALPALARASYLRELRGDVDGAVLALEQARTAGAGSPVDFATVTTLLGDLHLQHGDLQAAADAYDQALRLSPDLPKALIGRARVDAVRGARPAALATLEAVVDRYPLPQAAILLGDLRALAGDDAEAEDAYELVRATAALQRDAGQVVDLEMAVFEADHGDPALALDLARRAYAARPTVFAADAVAWALYRSGDPASALPFVEEALRLGTRDGLLRFHAAAVLAAAGEVERARGLLSAAFTENWFTVAARDEARLLGERLGIAAPAGWEPK